MSDRGPVGLFNPSTRVSKSILGVVAIEASAATAVAEGRSGSGPTPTAERAPPHATRMVFNTGP
jgi:hypothetical protein